MMKIFALIGLVCVISKATVLGQSEPNATFTVTLDPLDNGSLKVEPPLPPDGTFKKGTVLKVTATPAPGFAFDSGYYARPGMWGKMFYESMTPTFEVTVNQNKSLGASFIEQKALEGFTVKQDVIYAQ